MEKVKMFIKSIIKKYYHSKDNSKKKSIRLIWFVIIALGIGISTEFWDDIRIAVFQYKVNNKYYNENNQSTEVMTLINELPINTLINYLLQTNDIIVLDYAVLKERKDFIQSLDNVIKRNKANKNDLYFCSVAAQAFIKHPEFREITLREKRVYESSKFITYRYIRFSKWLKYFSMKYPSIPIPKLVDILLKPVDTLEQVLRIYKESDQEYKICAYIIEYAKIKKINTNKPLWWTLHPVGVLSNL